jgi:hypothetical protein
MLDQKPDQKLPADYWTTAEVIKEIFETKLCLAKSHSPDPCGGKIIEAHTIPRSQMQQIATDGHVYAKRRGTTFRISRLKKIDARLSD